MYTTNFNVNPKIFITGIVIALAAVIGIIAISGQSIFNDLSGDGIFSSENKPTEIKPIEIKLKEIKILQVDERSATIAIELIALNPNEKSVILPFISYQLYEKDQRIHSGEIGKRLESMVSGSDYITLLSNKPVTIKDKIILKNTGNTPEFWNDLKSNSTDWRIKGEVVFSLSSMTAGGQNEITFEFPNP